MVDMTACVDSRLSCDREPRKPPGPRFDLSSLVTDLVRFSGFDRNDRFEKKFVNLDVLCWSFWPIIGVVGADPRRHAFSYDVSAKQQANNNSVIIV
jgi:hypothetical protein